MFRIISGLIIFLFLFAERPLAQVISHEVGVGLVDLYSPANSSIRNSMLGSRYKLHIHKMAIRFGADFYYDENENKFNFNTNKYYLKTKQLKFMIGTERQALSTKKLQLYYGLDIHYSYSLSKSKTHFGFNFSENKTENKAAGFSPLAGMRYFLWERLSLGTEIKWVFEGYDNVSINKYNIVINKTTTKGSTFYMAPLGIISLNIHF